MIIVTRIQTDSSNCDTDETPEVSVTPTLHMDDASALAMIFQIALDGDDWAIHETVAHNKIVQLAVLGSGADLRICRGQG